MDHRVLEISFDIARIAGHNPNNPVDPRVLRFRDGVMAHVDAVLSEDGLGHGIAAEIEADKVQLRAVVLDFDAAEARLTFALDDSPYGAPAEILRYWDAQAVA